MRGLLVDGVAAVAAEIDRRLAAVLPESGARLSAAELHDRAAEYLRIHDDVTAWEPGLPRWPHWNLWMTDARFDDVQFAALVFRPAGVDFFCGTGEAARLRVFCEQESPADPEDLYAAMRTRFSIPEELLKLDRRAAEAWLGRPRPW